MQSLALHFKHLKTLTIRNCKCFLKDKAGVFFSFLSPLIVFCLYFLFLKQVQVDSLKQTFDAIPSFVYDPKNVDYFLNSWMLSGVLGTGVLTVALSSFTIMVQDKIQKLDSDFLVAPISGASLYFSYFLSAFFVTVVMNFGIILVGEILIIAMGGSFLSAGSFFHLLGALVLASFSACLLIVIIAMFIKSESVFSGVVAMVSAVGGFVIGAFMPISMFPKVLQYFCNVLPASHASAIFRNILLDNPMEVLFVNAPQEMVDGIKNGYSVELNFFGKTVGMGAMYIYICASIVVLIAVDLLLFKLKRNKKGKN